MSRKHSGLRSKSILSETLDQRLKMYSLAAAAAGVSLLALAQPADAEVVITRKTIEIGSVPISIDINGDGVADFQFQITSISSYRVGFFVTAGVRPLAGGEVVGEPGFFRPQSSYASALVRGAEIGPSVHFGSKGGAIIEGIVFPDCTYLMLTCGPFSVLFGDWGNVSNRYLGVKFLINGETHFGWVRLTVKGVAVQINGYAYETTPNKPILAVLPPEDPSDDSDTPQTGRNISPPFLGMLALSSNGLALWRREETLAS
jgi:hypothetical protein